MDFEKQPKAGDVFQTDKFFVDAAGVAHSVWCKILAIATFPNAGTASTAHGLAAVNLEVGFNVRRVNARLVTPPTVTMLDRSKFSFTMDATNLNITDTADYHLYTGEVWVEYCPA